MKTYVEISVEKELPKGVGSYFTIDEGFRSGIEGVKIKTTNFIGVNKRFGSPIHENYKTVYWLKEFPLPELMEEAIKWIRDNYLEHPNGWIKNHDDSLERKVYTEKELTEIYLTQKGII